MDDEESLTSGIVKAFDSLCMLRGDDTALFICTDEDEDDDLDDHEDQDEASEGEVSYLELQMYISLSLD